MAVIDGRWRKWRRLDFVEWEDIRLHDGENEMRGEGVGDRWWPETLYKGHQQHQNGGQGE